MVCLLPPRTQWISGTYFTKSAWTQKWNLVKTDFALILILLVQWGNEVSISHMSQQLRCCGKYDSKWLNTLRPRQNGRHFPDDIFKCSFLNKNVWISIKISLKFVPKGLINNIPALVQIMAWRPPGDKPLSEPMLVSLPTHICITQPQWVNLIIIFHVSAVKWVTFNSKGVVQLTRINPSKPNKTHTHTSISKITLTARFMGPSWSPSGADRTKVGPMFAPWIFLFGKPSFFDTMMCCLFGSKPLSEPRVTSYQFGPKEQT